MPLLARALTLLCSFPAPLMAEEHPVTRDRIILVPEPTLWQRLVGGYDLDVAAPRRMTTLCSRAGRRRT
ncbi:MAG: hypothetical protein AAFQ59_16365 [Pseudomonadota bacterium]